MNLFDRTYDLIIQSVEAGKRSRKSILLERVDEERFPFKTDKYGSVVCDFVVTRDGIESSVFAKCATEKFSFAITSSDGQTRIYDEKKFANNWPLDYNSFMETYAHYLDSKAKAEQDGSKDSADGGKIEVIQFSDLQDGEAGESEGGLTDPNVKKSTVIEVKDNDGPSTFIFGILNDDSNNDNVNLCQCEFQSLNEAGDETVYYKAAVYMVEHNSCVISIDIMDSDGALQEKISMTEMKTREPKLAKKLMKAIHIMEDWVESIYDPSR